MSQTYKLTTIKDIVEKIPADRISDCMDELKIVVMSAKAHDLALREILKEQGRESDGQVVVFPDVIEWMDDGEQYIESNLVGFGQIAVDGKAETITIREAARRDENKSGKVTGTEF